MDAADQPDAAAPSGVLRNQPDQRWTGICVHDDEPAAHLDLWLLTMIARGHGSGTCFGRLSVTPDARSSGLADPALRWAGAGLYRGGALAWRREAGTRRADWPPGGSRSFRARSYRAVPSPSAWPASQLANLIPHGYHRYWTLTRQILLRTVGPNHRGDAAGAAGSCPGTLGHGCIWRAGWVTADDHGLSRLLRNAAIR